MQKLIVVASKTPIVITYCDYNFTGWFNHTFLENWTVEK